jgi:rhodanese-related sulfurtransferase
MAYRDPREPFVRLTAVEAKRILENGGAQLVDAGDLGVQNGHILTRAHTGERRFPPSQELNADLDIIFVCSVGQRSALAWEMAAAAGLTRLYNLEGGTEAWVKEGYPFVK